MDRSPGRAMVDPFPVPGPIVLLAFWELGVAINGNQAEQAALGNHTDLPRPWDPASCRDPRLREQLWDWLDEVVVWLNREYTWDPAGMIPLCWPHHPHLVHEVAVLADQRRRAGLAKTSDALEEWHRYSLPAFADRVRGRLRAHCDEGHRPWPGQPRHHEYATDDHARSRRDAFANDVTVLRDASAHRNPRPHSLRLGVVDLETGELHQDQGRAGAESRTRTRKGPHV